MQGAQNFVRNLRDLGDALGKLFNVTAEEKEACYDQYDHDEKQCDENHSYSTNALRGCIQRAKIILAQCLNGQPEGRTWADVDTDGVEIPKRSKKGKR